MAGSTKPCSTREAFFYQNIWMILAICKKLPGKKISHTIKRRTISGLGIILARQKITDEEDAPMMLLRDGEPAVKAQAKEWPKEPKPVEKPLFSAYKMDRVPDVCDVMVKLRAKFAQYEEEDQQTGMSGVFCTIQARGGRGHTASPMQER